jgi:ADP-ribosylglycohydrolase
MVKAATGSPAVTAADRAAGVLMGLAAGAALAAPAAPHAELELALLLSQELLGGRPDLGRLARSWAGWAREHPQGLDAETRAALGRVEERGPAAAAAGAGAGAEPLARCLPVALACATTPRNLVSATFHIAALTHPDPRSAWAAVAINVAAAQLLQGHRDFVGDVIAALRNNDAPDVLIQAARRVPLDSRQLPAPQSGAENRAEATMELGLWLAYHEPVGPRGLRAAIGAGADPIAAGVAAALLGARDGEAALPPEAVTLVGPAAAIRDVAAALVGASAPS